MQTGNASEIKSLTSEFERIRIQQLTLCEKLENLADSLGAQLDRQQCIEIATELSPVMHRAYAFEENKLFPALGQIAAHNVVDKNLANKNLAANWGLKQLKLEHDEDACHVGEVVEALLEFGQNPLKISPDAIGYLLRGFFVGLRRHLALEEEVLRTFTVGSHFL